ncbi:MAG: FAD-dependent monooxygenase [Planctomycetaceae bacterium]|nr:FAD-dependent monooxygenase [Planctomycetaceae bacterium]
MSTQKQYDVVVVGASVGGCTAATLYAKRGLKVALLEISKDLAHYKKICTHYVQPVATDTIRKLGLAELIEAAGGRRNDLEMRLPWGWVRGGDPEALGYGYNIRRQMLDPILRDLAINTPGVSFFPGTSVRGVIRDDDGRVGGVVAEGDAGSGEFCAPLVVAADGRSSKTAQLAGVKAHVHDNGRFTYFTYYRGVPLSSGATSHYWHLHPNLAYAFRNDDDTTLLGIFVSKGALREFKADPMSNFRRFWENVPDPPLIGNASPISELRGITEIPNQWRPAAAPGIAFVGDAAMVLDPIWGTGCGFAFLSADWLVEHTAPAFGAGKDMLGALDRGLEGYRKVHRSRTRWHYAHIASFSKVRDYNIFERLVFSAATRDAKLATRVLAYISRAVGPFHLITPAALCRAVMVNLGAMLSGRNRPRIRRPREIAFPATVEIGGVDVG